MAEIKNLKTRISLRNDSISAWENSQDPVQLRKGEVAFGRLSGDLSDYYEMRVGVGDKTWTQLPGSNVMFKAENISDLSDYIQENAPTAKFFEVSAYAELPAENVPHGSIAVVKETVVKGEGESATSVDFRTAYWFDTELEGGTWRQMDGNYKAENVYFTDDLRLTEQFGKYKAVNTGYTLSCKNMSLDAVLKDAYAETKQPTITQPTVSFSLNKTSDSGEIGTTYTLPSKAGFKYTNDGNYEYGPATGVLVSVDITADVETGMTGVSQAGMKEGDSVSATVNNYTSAYTAGATVYNYKATYKYNEGAQPLDNIGGNSTKSAISAKSDTELTAKYTATGKYPYYMMFNKDGAACPETLNATTLKSAAAPATKTVDGKSCTQLATAGTWYKTLEVLPTNLLIGGTDKTGSYQNVYVVIPDGVKSDWDGTMSNGVDGVGIPLNHIQDVTVTLQNGEEKAYKAFIIANAAIVNDFLCQMVWS